MKFYGYIIDCTYMAMEKCDNVITQPKQQQHESNNNAKAIFHINKAPAKRTVLKKRISADGRAKFKISCRNVHLLNINYA